MKYEDIKKINKEFSVPLAVFEEHFDSFASNYSGKLNGEEVPAWRAFEIAFKRCELNGANTKRPGKKDSDSDSRSSKSRGKSTGSRSAEVDADSHERAEGI